MTLHINQVPQVTNYFHRESGMTLIEILVTLFILAVGLLGLAGLQSSSIKGGMDISQRSQALWLVNELADRMRANPNGMANYLSINTEACVAPANNCSDYGSNVNGATCTPVEIAAFDVWEVACGHPPAADNVLTNAVDSLDITGINITCISNNCDEATTAMYNVEVVYTSRLVNNSRVMDAENKVAQESQRVSIEVVPTYVPRKTI